MLAKAIQYVDFNGNKRQETFYFNLNKFELQKLVHSEIGGLETHLRRIVRESDGKKILGFIEDLISMAVGERSVDGSRFVKNDKIREDFESSAAFEELAMEFMEDPNGLVEFVKGILPASLAAAMDETNPLDDKNSISVEQWRAMSPDEFERLAGSEPKNWPKNAMLVAFERKNSVPA